MKSLTLACAAFSLAFVASAWAENAGPAMKAENAMKMESHDKMAGSMAMSGEQKDAMKPMAMKTADMAPKVALKGDMAMKPDMKH